MADPIIPIFKFWNAELGEWQWGLTPEDYHRVQNGYGCARCLEPFDYWVPTCYLCGQPNAAEPGVPVPAEWRKQGE